MFSPSDKHLFWIPAFIAITALSITNYYSRDRHQKKKINNSKPPQLVASLKNGFCGHNDVLISRLPLSQAGSTSWETLLHLFHESDACVTVQGDQLVSKEKSWSDLSMDKSDDEGTVTGVSISRATLITFLLLSNARIIYEYSDSSGYRAALGSWTGQWYISWRVDRPALVTLRPHDSHSPATDVYPPTFHARVDRCVQMMAGIIISASNPDQFRVAFPGRLAPGRWRLEYQPKGFGLSHGSRHIYNMNGGRVYEIDFLFTRSVSEQDSVQSEEQILYLPSLHEGQNVSLSVPLQEMKLLAQAMDSLPWANISWSVHRGMRDILLSFSRDTMEKYRRRLAQQLQKAATTFHAQLVEVGWEASFAQDYMGDMAASAILAGRGNSGDAVRIVTALAEQIHDGSFGQRDETTFWRQQSSSTSSSPTSAQELNADAVTALVKCFVLEWSVDFNYQIYHQLPIKMCFS